MWALSLAVLVLMLYSCEQWRGEEGEDECALAATADGCVDPESSGATTSPATTGPATTAVGPNNTPDGLPAAPPAKSSLAPGQQLFQGSSGDQIGYITSDGKFRYLSLERPGVVVGDAGITSQAMTWPTTGTVVSFGVRTSASSNAGQYGFNVFVDGATRIAGCSLAVGQTSCLFEAHGDLVAGDSVVIVIGESGHGEAKGDFTLDWWFVFEPAA